MKADTTKQRLLDSGLFAEESTNKGDCLISNKKSKKREACLFFNSSGDLINIEIRMRGDTW